MLFRVITVMMDPPLCGGLVEMIVPFPVVGKGARGRDIDRRLFPTAIQSICHRLLRDGDLPYTAIQGLQKIIQSRHDLMRPFALQYTPGEGYIFCLFLSR